MSDEMYRAAQADLRRLAKDLLAVADRLVPQAEEGEKQPHAPQAPRYVAYGRSVVDLDNDQVAIHAADSPVVAVEVAAKLNEHAREGWGMQHFPYLVANENLEEYPAAFATRFEAEVVRDHLKWITDDDTWAVLDVT